MLLTARDADDVAMTDRQVRDEVITIMSASYDTTALALTWGWVLLSQHPSVAGRLFANIDAVLGDALPTASDLARLPEVKQFVAETLRLYPSSWAIGREAVNDTWLGGQRIRKGTMVLLSPWLLHHDARFFDQPATFPSGAVGRRSCATPATVCVCAVWRWPAGVHRERVRSDRDRTRAHDNCATLPHRAERPETRAPTGAGADTSAARWGSCQARSAPTDRRCAGVRIGSCEFAGGPGTGANLASSSAT